MNELLYKGAVFTPDPHQILGEGGEAVVYRLGNNVALKIYRQPSDRYYLDIPDPQQRKCDQEGAKRRLEIIQKKLRRFPPSWSPRIVAPIDFVTNRSKSRIYGYAMASVNQAVTLRAFTRRKTRPTGVDNNTVLQVFRDLHATVEATHRAKVVIGDFNYFNVLVQLNDWHAYLIDADSMQFGSYLCETFQSKFVDPLLCHPQLKRLVKIAGHPYTPNSDWYAYSAMLFEALLFVPLYGGSYNPSSALEMVELDQRPLQRIWVGHPRVNYPLIGVLLKCIEDDLLDYYHKMVVENRRETFPKKLLDRLRWTSCTTCGLEHCKPCCPDCARIAPVAAVKETIRGKVRAIRVFESGGQILRAAIQGGRLHYLFHNQGKFFRGSCKFDGKQFRQQELTTLFAGELLPQMRFAIRGEDSIVAVDGQLLVLQQDGTISDRLTVDLFRDTLPVFATNESRLYWIATGELLRSNDLGVKRIGQVLRGQTLFWVGPKFGFGLYRTGQIQICFVFDVERAGLKDTVAIPSWHGELIDANCVFDTQRCWFLTSIRQGTKVCNHCYVLKADGTVTAQAQCNEDDGSWLGNIRGKCAVTLTSAKGDSVHVLYSAQESGVVRIHEQQQQLVEGAHFPDTQGFVNPNHELLLGKEGLFAIDRRTIRCIQLL